MEDTAFLRGMGAGIAAGAAIGMIVNTRKGMKTRVGRSMHQMGCAMDSALYDVLRKLG